MTATEKLLQAAFDEVGYLEKRSNAELDSKTANAGQNNWTKYWRDLKPDFQGQPWCDCFVSWLFYKLFGEALGNEMLCGGLRSYYTPASANLYAAKGRLGAVPQVGDQVFFTKNGQTSGCYHTGIVYAVDSAYFYTVEGNTSGASGVVSNGDGVAKKKYSISAYKGKVIFGHPKYDTANKSGGGTKTVAQVANEVIAGAWGTGDDRRKRLAAAGYSYMEVQAAVNAILNSKAGAKSVTQVAKEVIAGKWGNGDARTQKLKVAGYDPAAVQKEVNRLLKK